MNITQEKFRVKRGVEKLLIKNKVHFYIEE